MRRRSSIGRAIRGEHCLVVVLECPGEPRKVAFVASRKGVGGAVQRNRARRRLRGSGRCLRRNNRRLR